MKKCFLFLMALALSLGVVGQQPIVLRSADKAECVSSDNHQLRASFSFSTIEAEQIDTQRGEFSWLSMPNTVIGGNEGDPQIPVVNELIAVPFGAQPSIRVTSFSTTDYRLEDYGIGTLIPRQPSLRKDQRPEDVPFVYNAEAYQTRGLRSEPQAVVSVVGTMRGVQLGRMTIEPVSYDPVNNTLRVFNNIEVEVSFDGADAAATEEMLLKTYSPHFDVVYQQLFNYRAIADAYTDHPDLYNTPVRMLVICYSGFQGNSALNSWLEWKLQKGYYVDIFYTNETGTTAASIKNFITTKYNASVSAGNAYTYLIVIGDTGQVPQYMTKTIDSSIGECASDLGYSSVNFSTSSTTNYFPDMYYSRMSVENTTHLTNYINKVLTYEKFEFADGGNYLNNVILVGGWDSNWTSRVAKPTINYATNNYFNSSNTTYGGFSGGTIRATISTSSTQGWSGTNHGCYNGLNDGVCFLNYTAHGDKQEWQGPQFTAKQAEGVTNTGKYFFAVGNCCLTGNYNLNNANYSSSYAPSSSIGATACFGETMIRVPNAGAIAYVGCSPYSYWYEDFYWAVGAHSFSAGNAPTVSGSTKGVYDVMFDDGNWNSASALLYLGNLAVQQAVTNGNTNSSITDGNCRNSAHYYFQFYHTFGDGSIMPYITKPEANTVTIPSTVTPGTSSITVNALAGSYVAVTDNSSVIYGVAEANSSGVATVNFTNAIPGSGTLHVVVTRQQYQPYFGTIQITGGTQYNITVTQPQHGTISAPAQAYANSTVTLTATPETGYCLSSWTVKKGNTNIAVTNNQFIMPEGDVTVTATFVQGMQVTLASVMNGTISADPLYALQGMTINLTATPAEGYEFGSWSVYKTGDINTTVTVNGDSFTMPNYPVTVSAIFNQVVSEDVTIGSGTGTTNGAYLPTYAYYNYSLSQQIYTSSEVGSAGTITKVAFKVSNSKSTTRELVIYMSHTSTSTFSSTSAWITQNNTNLVFSGSVNFNASGWTIITLDTPFEYNGTSNLLLTVDDNTGSYVSSSSNSPSFYTYSTGGNTALYLYNDNTNYAPASIASNGTRVTTNNQVIFTKEVPSTEGYLSVSPTSLTGFNTVSGTASSAQNVAVIGSNLQSNLTVTAPSGFEVSSAQNGTYNGTLTLTPSNGSIHANVYVRIKANASAGNLSGNMTLASGTTTATVSLSGTVTPGASTQYTIAANANPTAGGTVSGAGTYNENGTCTLTATAATGYTFTQWQDGNTDNPRTIIVTSNATYTANFTLNSYAITASVNPANAGTITGAGTYNHGATATLTATANTGYTFTSWTKNGTEVSTNATYSFSVTEAATLVANFTPMSYVVTAVPNPAEGGTVAFGGRGNRDQLVYDFEDGWQGWTTFQGNTTSPNSWMHNTAYPTTNNNFSTGYGYNSSDGFMLSESYISGTSSGSGTAVTPDNYLVSPQVRLGGSISFYAGGRNTSYCAEKFSVMVSTTDNTNVASFTTIETWTLSLSQAGYNSTPYTVDLSAYSGMGYIAIRHFDCYDQWFLCVDNVTIVEGEEDIPEDNTISGTFNYGESCTLVATPNANYHFVNWTENGTVVSSDASYSFTVTADRDLVANFSDAVATIEETIELGQGWNWWSPINDIELADFEAALGSYGLSIVAQDGSSVTHTGNTWSGNLTTLDVRQMYMVQTSEAVTVVVNGLMVDPTEHPLILNPGPTWIGILGTEEKTLEEALPNPNHLDYIKTVNGVSVYYQGKGWKGSISTMKPGQGYIYYSNANTSKTISNPSVK